MALPQCRAPHALPSLLPTQALPSLFPPDLLLIIAEQGEGVTPGPLCEHLSLGVPTSGLSPWSQQMLGLQALSAVWVIQEFPPSIYPANT